VQPPVCTTFHSTTRSVAVTVVPRSSTLICDDQAVAAHVLRVRRAGCRCRPRSRSPHRRGPEPFLCHAYPVCVVADAGLRQEAVARAPPLFLHTRARTASAGGCLHCAGEAACPYSCAVCHRVATPESPSPEHQSSAAGGPVPRRKRAGRERCAVTPVGRARALCCWAAWDWARQPLNPFEFLI
jgi:hypothetical protein